MQRIDETESLDLIDLGSATIETKGNVGLSDDHDNGQIPSFGGLSDD